MLMVTTRSMVNAGALPAAFAALRAAGIPVGIGAARPNLPVRLQGVDGLGRVVMHNFFGVMIPYAGVEDIMGQQASAWQSRRGNDTGYACSDLQRDPGTAARALVDLATDHCGLAAEACTGVDVPGTASQLAAQYAAWFASAFPKGWGDCYNYDAATFAQKFPGANQADYWTKPSWSTSVADAPTPYVATPAPAPYVQPPVQVSSPTPTGGGPSTAYSVPTGYVAPNTPAPTVAPTPSAPAPSAGSTGGGGVTSTGLPTAAPAPAPVASAALPSWLIPAAAAAFLLLMVKR